MAFIVECGHCGTNLEVPDGSEGKKFRCSACKKVLVVPGGEEEDAPKPEAPAGNPPSPRPRAGKRKPRAGARAKRGRGASRETRSAGGREDAAQQRSRLPRVAGVGLGLLGVAGAAVALALFAGASGKGSDSSVPPGGDEAAPAGPDDPAAGGKGKPDARAPDEPAYRRRIRTARDGGDWLEAGLAARKAGAEEEARILLLRAVAADPDLDEAFEALGYRRYAIPDDDRYLLEAKGLLEILEDLDGRWLDPRKVEEIVDAEPEHLEKARALFEKRKSNVHFSTIEEIRKRVLTGKGFNERIWGSRPAMPYIVFDERGKKGEMLLSKEDSEFLVKKKLRMLHKVYAFIVERWMEPQGFSRDPNKPLVAIIFQDRKSFEDYNHTVGMYIPKGGLAYFHRLTKFIYMYDAASASAEGQDHQDGILFHEATHQIVDAFLASGAGMARVSYWFNEGIAEYVGSVKRRYEENGEPYWEFGAENPGRIREFWKARRPDLNAGTRRMGITSPYHFSLHEIVTRCRTTWNTMRTLRGKIPPAAWSRFQSSGAAGSLIYAQASFLLYFAYACGNPAYAKAMDAYLLEEFHGRGGLQSFLDAFGLASKDELEDLDRAYLDFHESLVPEELKRKR